MNSTFNNLIVISIFSMLLIACVGDKTPINAELDNALTKSVLRASKDNTLSYYILPSETDFDNIPQEPSNPLNQAKVDLGKFLFFDTGIAQDALFESGIGTYSCATCHVPEAGFKPGNFQGIADGGLGFGINGEDRVMNYEDYQEADLDVQSARPLSLLNVAFVNNTFWNGQFGATDENEGTEDMWGVLDHATELNHMGLMGLETQNIEGMIVHRMRVDKEIADEFGYTEMFDSAFPDLAGQDTLYSNTYASFAISAYLRTVLSNKAPFQDWLKGKSNAMTAEEKEGAILFFNKANCSRCHYEPNLGSLEFHALGVKDMYQLDLFDAHPDDLRNRGRAGFTNNPEDEFKFKVPGIYNVDNLNDQKFLFHGASMQSVRELLEYKNEAVSENPNIANEMLSDKFEPLFLTDSEITKLEAFLVNGLRDPDLTRYAPDEVPSGQCFPNADPESLRDLGCE